MSPAPHAATDQPLWNAGWAAAMQRPSTGFDKNWAEEGFDDETVRQIVRVTGSGTAARIKLSHRYGTGPLEVSGAALARTDTGAAVLPGSTVALTFGGAASVTVPAGGEVYSDPAETVSWYHLAAVELAGGPARADTVVVFGDSITDGFSSTVEGNRRYSDAPAERPAGRGTPRPYKPNPDHSAAELIAGYRDLIEQVHAAGVRVTGATVLPFKGSEYHTPKAEAKRREVNAWIRTSGEFDAVADFAAVFADPADADRLAARYDCL